MHPTSSLTQGAESLSNDVDYVAEVSTRRPDALVQAGAADREYYDNAKSSATNAAAYIGWHFGGLLNETGYELAKGGRSVYRFGTDANTRAAAFATVNYALSNPGVVARGVVNGISDFANKPFSEQADSVFKFGVGGLAGAGAGKVGVFAFQNTVAGAAATARFVAPKVGDLLETYMARTGGLAYAVPPGGANSTVAREIMNTTPAGSIVESGSGSIFYGAKDALGRPTGIIASITDDMIKTGTPANPGIHPPGWAGDGTKFNQARGHLLGNQLGGSGDMVENLVTLQQNWVNSPVMRGYEGQVRAAVEAGQTIQYSATPMYNGTNLIPRGVTLIGTGNNGFNLGVTVLNPIGF